MSGDRSKPPQDAIRRCPKGFHRSLNPGEIFRIYAPRGIDPPCDLVDVVAGIAQQGNQLFQFRQGGGI